MNDRDDLVWVIADALAADDPEASCAHNLAPVADAVIDAGWVSPEVHQEALDAMALQVTYTEDGTWDVLRRLREARATVQRVRHLCERWEGWTDTDLASELQPPLKVHLAARDLRAALDGPGGGEAAARRDWQPGDGDDRCQDCGCAYRPWFADNGVWNLVMGGPDATDDPGGCLCPRCFMERAAAAGQSGVWRLTREVGDRP